MNKVMKVGRYIGIYEANEKTALWKHHGRERADSWKIKPSRAPNTLLGIMNLTLKVLEREPLKVLK